MPPFPFQLVTLSAFSLAPWGAAVGAGVGEGHTLHKEEGGSPGGNQKRLWGERVSWFNNQGTHLGTRRPGEARTTSRTHGTLKEEQGYRGECCFWAESLQTPK